MKFHLYPVADKNQTKEIFITSYTSSVTAGDDEIHKYVNSLKSTQQALPHKGTPSEILVAGKFTEISSDWQI